MIRFHGRVVYKDGTEETFECGPAAVSAWERYAIRHKQPYGDESPPTLSNHVIAHYALGIEQGFDAWEETLDGVEVTVTDPDGEGAVPPTPEAPSPA